MMSSQESNEDANRDIDDMRASTEEMTGKLEMGVRMMIDASEEVNIVERALQELEANITAGSGVLAPTQSTLGASQFRRNRRLDVDDDNENEEENIGEGAVEALKQKIGQHRAAYEASTLTDRYASHNDYVGFKKIVHDAHYPGEEAPPMPHASTWFGESGSTQLSSNNGPRGTQPDEDDDLVMASERISVKCPITLTEMKDPVSSTKCPHNFEKQAFLEMVNNSDLRIGNDGRRNLGTKAMRCPVAGCDVVGVCTEIRLTRLMLMSRPVKVLMASDIHTDVVMTRKIKRIQAALHASNEPDYDDEEAPSMTQRKRGEPGHHDEEITSSSPPPQASQMSAAQAKAERMSQVPNPRQVSMVPNSQIVDMEDEEDEEED